MKEMTIDAQREVQGGSIYAISTICIVASIGLYRMLKVCRFNLAKVSGRKWG